VNKRHLFVISLNVFGVPETCCRGAKEWPVNLRTTPLIDYREGIIAARVTALAALVIVIACWLFLSI
jgi:hypothetical protein